MISTIALNTMYHILNAIYQESNDEIDGKVVDLLQSKIDKVQNAYFKKSGSKYGAPFE
jgi:hypothetical protein